MKRILIVEDEPSIAEVVEFALRKGGLEARSVGTFAEGLLAFEREGADLVILDLGLPDGNGLDLCRRLRARSQVPILILTCRDEEVDRIVGLETGADDYVVKPFSPREVLARVRSILRRSEGPSTESAGSSPLTAGRVTLRPAEHQVMLDGREARLTPTEFQMLRVLLSAPDRVLTREVLIQKVYDGNTFVSDRTMDSHVKGIRRKFALLDPTADPIETVFGVGYRARVIQ